MNRAVVLTLLVLWGIARPGVGLADDRYAFTCADSEVKGSIKYSVLGTYQATFKECSGVIHYDKIKKQVQSVSLKIKAVSIHSDCGWCDRIVVSHQLLDSAVYPWITFTSDSFGKNADGPWTHGTISVHGVTKTLKSPFSIKRRADGSLFLKGKWVLRRKDFKIIWNMILDHGGIVVGDHVTVDWAVIAKKAGKG